MLCLKISTFWPSELANRYGKQDFSDIYSEQNRDLAFHFDNYLNAPAFQGIRQLAGMTARILDDKGFVSHM